MVKNISKQSAPSSFHRAGEGAMVDVVQHLAVGVSGQTTNTLSVSLENAPVPDRRYVADVASVSYSNETIKLVFGQEKLASLDLRSALVIQMSAVATIQFIRSLEGMGNPSLNEVSQKYKFIESLYDITKEPEQTVALAANMVAVAVNGRVTTMDFYQVSSFSVAATVKNRGKQIAVDPVVRVDIRTSLLNAIYKKLCSIESSFPSEELQEAAK